MKQFIFVLFLISAISYAGINNPSASTGGVTSFNSRTGAVVPATNDYTWAQINKTVSSLANLATRSTSELSDGSNIALLNTGNTFSVGQQTINIATNTHVGLTVKGAASQSGDLFQAKNSSGTVLYHIDASGYPSEKIFLFEDQKTNGTAGGTATSGSWLTRDLNTSTDIGTGITLSSNQLTVPAGSYCANIHCPFHGIVNRARCRLRNVTDSATLLEGTNACETGGGSTFFSHITGCFTLAAQKTIEVQYRVQTTVTSSGLGFENGGIFTDQAHETFTSGWLSRYSP